jgi:hypothetical protein
LPDGTINAEANGSKLVITGSSNPNVSGESHLEYSLIGGQPYLSMDFIWNEPKLQVAFSIYGGSSHLTLTLSNIDVATNSGDYLLSGIWDGTAVSQTSKADLTLDLRSYGPVNGWPVGAFKAELAKVAVFNPLGITLRKNFVAKRGEPSGESGAPVIREKTAAGFLAGPVLAA